MNVLKNLLTVSLCCWVWLLSPAPPLEVRQEVSQPKQPLVLIAPSFSFYLAPKVVAQGASKALRESPKTPKGGESPDKPNLTPGEGP